MRRRSNPSLFLAALFCLAWTSAAVALEPGQILLVVNQRVPEGRKLAEYYCEARGVPLEHIVELNLPSAEDLSYSAYEQQVVAPLRLFLRERKLDAKITCIVTFYGMPLRVGPRVLTAEEKQELDAIQGEMKRIFSEALATVTALEAEVKRGKPDFAPAAGEEVERLAARAQAGFHLLAEQATRLEDAEERAGRMRGLVGAVQQLAGPAGVLSSFAATGGQGEPEKKQLELVKGQITEAQAEIGRLRRLPQDPAARARLRKVVGGTYGKLDLIRVMQQQVDFLDSSGSQAALDSELALLRWHDFYPRAKWQPNPLHFRSQVAAGAPAALMVMRLDAPQAGQVRNIIAMSIKAEREGLKGKLVLDSRGIVKAEEKPAAGGYWWYDESIRELAKLAAGKVPVLHDDSDGVLPANSANDVAMYCGWYSLRNYVPACRFNPGAVGLHVASLEMVSLRGENEKGWVKGMLDDGVAATMGAVAEPYLLAFPKADEFFPLLMTGQLTLAEVYWKTTPCTSWMMCMIGDPLYRPYQAKPALEVEKLPEALRSAVKPRGEEGER